MATSVRHGRRRRRGGVRANIDNYLERVSVQIDSFPCLHNHFPVAIFARRYGVHTFWPLSDRLIAEIHKTTVRVTTQRHSTKSMHFSHATDSR